jgi:hypothetical protein
VQATESGAELIRFTFSPYRPDIKLEGDPIVEIALEKFGKWKAQPVIPSLQQLRDSVVGIASHLSATP